MNSDKISKFQNFDTETIHRSKIKNAEYNPRIMDKTAKERLRKNIRKHGLVSALTWNRRTGNLVGGHQRLEQLDVLEKSGDYELSVCVIDVDEREEAALNVQLNNPSMQGEWDLEKLEMMSENFDLSFTDDMGFTNNDIDFMFEGKLSDLYENEEVDKTKSTLDDIKKSRNESREKLKERGNINFYCVLVFENETEKKEFYKKISIPFNEQYITVNQVLRIKDR